MEAVKINEVEKLRFRVHRDHGVVTFYGSIGDTPDTAALDGILLNDSVCDMRHLAFASWIGLATLGDYIQQRKLKLTFRALPFAIYDALRLNKAFEDQNLESAELPLVNVTTQRVSFEMIEFSLLRKDAEQGQEWVYPRAGFLLLLPTRYIFPDLTAQRSTGFLPVQVLTSHKDIASFWLQYGSFCQTTVEISNTLVHAAKLNMLQILYEIKAKTTAGEQALKLVDSTTNYTLVLRLDVMMRDIEKDLDGLADQVEAHYETCEQKLADLSLLALDKGCDLPKFAASLQSYATAIDSLRAIATICEDCGAQIGTRLGTLRPSEVIQKGLAGVDNPEPEVLNSIRAAFAIMDIMSEDDWPASRDLIMAEITAIDTLFGQCVVTLQVFDMMRQILEHRIGEMNLVLAASQTQGMDHLLDPDLREAVLNKIGTHMVTEQEKAAFAFYLPDGFQKFGQTERKEPGDVLLF
ncbi:MAG TPA: hypothetical protein VE954_25865 [Oligoflexus sp.]|uniref:hypothetical protein n=1 Tax=Oligoflexus sp. TaxID=1971216 RepID=UPI002D3921EB|nr:hypothetical protein [Oligoflexus sp.]HYX36550.1 hypothetical protein [Oligoflexus sp.]